MSVGRFFKDSFERWKKRMIKRAIITSVVFAVFFLACFIAAVLTGGYKPSPDGRDEERKAFARKLKMDAFKTTLEADIPATFNAYCKYENRCQEQSANYLFNDLMQRHGKAICAVGFTEVKVGGDYRYNPDCSAPAKRKARYHASE